MAEVWEDLRKRARLLENHIDVKLVTLNKLACGTSGRCESTMDEKTDMRNKQDAFDSLSTDLEGMLAKLTQINDQMNDYVTKSLATSSSGGWSSNPTLQHMLRRHREILRDYLTEFGRSQENVKNQLQREKLLSGGSSSENYGVLNNRVKFGDMLLKEADHISSCDRLLDEQIRFSGQFFSLSVVITA
ncbi:hypothetical protein AB6A40_004800 [Gnathostoma spinigerum]|uniref:Golgi SNAP receptor complex member 1 n=1 Tax=Gnathostoma spinigerum TaxID=75299 RepID=A0ABD6EFX0_9BILA